MLAVLICSAAIAVAIPFIGRAEKIEPSPRPDLTKLETGRVETAPGISSEDEPQVLSLEVTPWGFQPSEAIVPRGRLLILLQNRTGVRDLNFWLARENRELVVESQPDKRDWKAHVQLGPGTYIIGETNHPEWQFTLRVTK